MNPEDTQAGFLSEIRENPDDDELRLIYADWLDDQDASLHLADEGRAEFIRLQVNHYELHCGSRCLDKSFQDPLYTCSPCKLKSQILGTLKGIKNPPLPNAPELSLELKAEFLGYLFSYSQGAITEGLPTLEFVSEGGDTDIRIAFRRGFAFIIECLPEHWPVLYQIFDASWLASSEFLIKGATNQQAREINRSPFTTEARLLYGCSVRFTDLMYLDNI